VISVCNDFQRSSKAFERKTKESRRTSSDFNRILREVIVVLMIFKGFQRGLKVL
jgi:hypothetical protein